jgi:hypothetical protein
VFCKFPVTADMSPFLEDMVNLARRYCELIESSGADDGSWLARVSDLLPRIHATLSLVDGSARQPSASLKADLDARFELYTHLRELLGDRDGYWMEFDRSGDFHAMTGSLADDLTDIYCELKHGLRLVEERPELAADGWLIGFEHHWGRHLVDAERHLAELASQGRLT